MFLLSLPLNALSQIRLLGFNRFLSTILDYRYMKLETLPNCKVQYSHITHNEERLICNLHFKKIKCAVLIL